MTFGKLNPTLTSDQGPQSLHAKSEDLMRLSPLGIRRALLPVARGGKDFDDLPDFALEWLQKHDVIRPAKRAGYTWVQQPKCKVFLHRIKERYR